ncbi:hypothetical protein [uncultured Mediterranean phage uvDeep-CGR2-KM20-C133]|nr:hypothetical protein [uncultured Mediterranean phage uvDeep-CGR2-KM20-C133]
MDDSSTLHVLPEGHWKVEPVQGWPRERIEVRGKRSDYYEDDWPKAADYLEVRAREFDPAHGIDGRYSAKRYAIPVPGDAGDECRCYHGSLCNGLGIDDAFLGDYLRPLTSTQRLCVLMYSNYLILRSITRVAYVVVVEGRDRGKGQTRAPLQIDFNSYADLTERHDMRHVPPNLDFIAWWDPCLEVGGCPKYDLEFDPDAVADVADQVEWASNARQRIFGGKLPPT